MNPELFFIGQQFVALMPDAGRLARLRYRFYRRLLKQCGEFKSCSQVKIFCPQRVTIGSGVSLNIGVMIDACNGGSIDIGANVLIGPYSIIRSADHGFSDLDIPIESQKHVPGPIVIEDDCWLGGHVVVTRNVRIGRGSVIGAHSVVTRDVPPFSLAVGVPARVIRTREPEAASARPQ
jgi:acetyltransferase-like isoleucine patch superfamily enzyme